MKVELSFSLLPVSDVPPPSFFMSLLLSLEVVSGILTATVSALGGY